jgi:DNA-binding transcriptional LysR family regulator
MEMKDLQAFRVLADEMHFGRAAERLNISQPPLSRRIAALEEELGVKLLARTSRKVELTREGQAFLEEALIILRRAEAAADYAREVARGEAGRLKIGFVQSAMAGQLPHAIRMFMNRHPKISLELKEAGTADQLSALRRGTGPGRLDAGFMFTSERDLAGLEVMTFMNEPLVLAVAADHELADTGAAPMRKLAGVPLIMFPRKSQPALYDRIMSDLRDAGVEPRVALESGGPTARVDLAAAGLGAALVPASMMNYLRRGVVYRELKGEAPTLDVALAWREKDDNPALANFLDTVAETGRGEGVEDDSAGEPLPET